ncbi:hypothetical protein BC629DRAFT_1446107 [Irpex lacteus]|nr:hypothetical protein BC629DRAFT_1446107 [Irpex lacteus]
MYERTVSEDISIVMAEPLNRQISGEGSGTPKDTSFQVVATAVTMISLTHVLNCALSLTRYSFPTLAANSTIQQLVCVPGLTSLRAKHCYQIVSVSDSRNYYVCRLPNMIVLSLRDRFSPLGFINNVHSATIATFRDSADSSS